MGWLYRHDWQLGAGLALAVIAVAIYVFWPRPAATPMLAP
jgi:hypothetical protein